LRDADEAVKLDPNAPANYVARAAVMRALSRNDDAIADLRKALTSSSTDARKRPLEGALRELGASLTSPCKGEGWGGDHSAAI
jgi:regulator of sirC expression with transglutaminase-like and TPR domain